MQGRDLTETQIERFLQHLAGSANVSASAQAAGISRSTFYALRNDDDQFATAWTDALETAVDALEGEARRRAVEGFDEYIIGRDGLVYGQDGKPVMQRRYSDSLLALLLRAHRPDKFRDRREVRLADADGNKIAFVLMGQPEAASDEQWQQSSS